MSITNGSNAVLGCPNDGTGFGTSGGSLNRTRESVQGLNWGPKGQGDGRGDKGDESGDKSGLGRTDTEGNWTEGIMLQRDL